uniref:Uncharacterized protein n=1 Tax=uncultured Armatimonadetes bacterium TaxID=157466 RepID=A0A6J4J150_9BACT|nr:hypothetical protein AVDCRST_MAG63-2700 [uncultured Armatimonadetes bacterium]
MANPPRTPSACFPACRAGPSSHSRWPRISQRHGAQILWRAQCGLSPRCRRRSRLTLRAHG